MSRKMFYSVLGWTAAMALIGSAASVCAEEKGPLVSVEAVEESSLKQIENYDFCSDAENPEYAVKVLFQVNEPVTDFSYSSFLVNLTDEGEILMEDKKELFYAEEYAPEQCFVAELEFMEFMPTHCVEFIDMEDIYHCYLLSESGEDGRPIVFEYESAEEDPRVHITSDAEDKSVTLSLDANATTGYIWTGFVIGGSSVELKDERGCYEEDENPEMLDGVGGTTYFQLNPVEPGLSIVRFDYARGWEEGYIDRTVFLADVDEELNLTLTDVTLTSMALGTVTNVDEETHTVTYLAESGEEVIAVFDEELALPVVDEEICVYTTGVMTMSLPPMVNVLAWETIPDEYARA